MEPYQERVLTEYRELYSRLEKLRNFLYGDSDESLSRRVSHIQLRLLYRQEVGMEVYGEALQERLDDFNSNKETEDENE